MATFRALVIATILGAFVGIVLTTLAADSLISAELCGFTSDALTSRPCLDTVHSTVAKVIRTQMMGGGIGCVFGLVVGIWWVRRKSAKSTITPPTRPTPPSAASGI